MNRQKKLHPELWRIRASAGSGKTHELTRHYLELLARAHDDADAGLILNGKTRGYPWTGILAATFTNGAAFEMKERIIRTLKSMALGLEKNPPNGWDARFAEHWLNIIFNHYSGLNVRTIDSLIHTLVRASSLTLGIAPDFTPVFNLSQALSPLIDEILEKSRTEKELADEISRVCRLILSDGQYKGFMNSAGLRGNVLALLDIIPADLNTPDEKILQKKLENIAENLRHTAKKLHELTDKSQLLLTEHAKKALDSCCEYSIKKPLKTSSTTLKAKNIDEWIKKAGKGQYQDKVNLYFDSFSQAVAKEMDEGKILRSALKILPYVQLALRIKKYIPEYLQKSQNLPANNMYGLAEQALNSAYGLSETFYRLGTSLSHILLDEFQDTSRIQWEALRPLATEALSRGGSLVLVGDVKQSIYAWRGAYPKLFEEVAHDPEIIQIAGTLTDKNLPVNYRSRNNIIIANNSIFSLLADYEMAKKIARELFSENPPEKILEQTAKDIALSYRDAKQNFCGKQGGYVCIDKIESTGSEENKEKVAVKVVELTQKISQRRPLGDIGILVRTNDLGKALAKRLLEEGFAVVTKNSLLLSEHPLILKCLAFLEWLNAPHNDLAFWTMLSKPGLIPMPKEDRNSLEDWLCCLERDKDKSVAEYFARDFPEVWQYYLEPFQKHTGLMSAYDAIQEMLKIWQVWERWAESEAFLQRFLECLYLTEQNGHFGISAFLDYWKKHGGEEKAPMPNSVDAVRIMTIHDAKGLQFPVVIVPSHSFFSENSKDDYSLISFEGLNLITRPVKNENFYAEQAINAQECLNLFYVAWTRAEEELYAIMDNYPRMKKRPGLHRALPLLFENLPAAWKKHADGGLSFGDLPPCKTKKEKKRKDTPKATYFTYEAARKNWRPMDWLPDLRIFRNDPQELFFSSKRRGTFIHTCLEYFSDHVRWHNSLPQNDEELEELILSTITDCRASFPMPVPDDILPQISKNMLWLFKQPDMLRLIKNGSAEQELLDASGKLHRPDLLCRENDGEDFWLVLEYKTGNPATEQLREHKKQLGGYLDLLFAATALRAKGRLVYLDMHRIEDIDFMHSG